MKGNFSNMSVYFSIVILSLEGVHSCSASLIKSFPFKDYAEGQNGLLTVT